MTDQSEPALVLRADGLSKKYGKRTVVDNVSMELPEGRIVGLLGPNGAGKTTTFSMITGFLAPNRGTVSMGGRDLTGLPMYRRARLGIGYLAQEPSIFRNLTVEQNLRAILQTRKLSRRQQKDRLAQLLEELGITHLARKATTRWLSENQAGYAVTDEHRIYIEDFIQNSLGTEGLALGETRTTTFEMVAEAVTMANELSESQLQNLSQYTAVLT